MQIMQFLKVKNDDMGSVVKDGCKEKKLMYTNSG